jgi:hypothetical protein
VDKSVPEAKGGDFSGCRILYFQQHTFGVAQRCTLMRAMTQQ